MDGGDKTYVASEKIQLTNGYSYSISPLSTDKMHAYIDASSPQDINVTTYSAFHNFSTFPNRTINTNLPVGRIKAQYSVKPSGAVSYNIPVKLPKGVNNLEPELSIVYNSLNGSGLMGVGWNLNGLSKIFRTTKNIFVDNDVSSINFTNDDVFTIDGNRLIPTSSNNGNDGTTYGTHSESFIRATSKGSVGGGPSWFKVETKSGLTKEFGNSQSSKQILSGETAIASWHLNRVYDNFGNECIYEYRSENDESLLHKISYGYTEVILGYEEKLDKNKIYSGGTFHAQNVVLSSITILQRNRLVRRYRFNYSYNLNTFLTEVIESGSDDSQFNSTIFNYGDPLITSSQEKIDSTTVYPVNPYGIGAKYWPGDFNGDGLTDLICFPYDLILSSSSITWLDWTVFINTGDNNFQEQNTYSFPSGFQPIEDFNNKQSGLFGNTTLNSIDLNGDGREDFIFSNIGGSSSVDYNFYPYLSNGNNFIAQSSFTVNTPSGISAVDPTLFFADLNGDRNTDLFIHHSDLSSTSNTVIDIKFNSDHTDSRNITNQTVNSDYKFNNSLPLDMDGDGKYEIVNIYNTNDSKYYSMVLSGTQLVFNEMDQLSLQQFGVNKMFGDFNGDGMIDVLKYTGQMGTIPYHWDIDYSTGDGIINEDFGTDFLDPIESQIAEENISQFVIDINGDGKSDILEIESDYGNPTQIFVHYSNGLSFEKKIYSTDHYFNKNSHEIEFGDYDGDGIIDILFIKPGGIAGAIGSKYLIYNFGKNDKSTLLHAAADGFNNIVQFNYDYLTSDLIYTKGNSSTYPMVDIQPSMTVVSSMIEPDGIGGTSTTNYFYEEARSHALGKGFLGFKRFIAENSTEDVKTIDEFEVDLTFYVNTLHSKEVEVLSSNELLRTTAYNFLHDDLGDNRYYTYLESKIQTDELLNFATTTDFEYDDYGNVELIDISRGGNETEEITNVYEKHGSWIPSKLTNTTVLKSRVGSPNYTRETVYNYNSNGTIQNKTDDPSDAKSIVTSYTYNSNGSMASMTMAGTGVATISNFFKYDPSGIFITKSTNNQGKSTLTTYDYKWGVILSETNENGLTVKNEYDGFGRLIKSSDPNLNETNLNLSWEIGSGGGSTPTSVNNSVYKLQKVSAGKPIVSAWYDKFERKRKQEVDAFGQKAVSVTSYNSKGLVNTVTEPFVVGSSSSPIITTNYYNSRKELETSIVAGESTNYSYDYSTGDLQLTTTSASNSRTQTIDPTGKLVASDDGGGGNLTFTYYASGKEKEVRLNGNIITSMTYDLQGNQTQLDDANAGVTDYTYNANNKIKSQSDDKGTTNITYTTNNQIETVVNPLGTITYSYYENGGETNKVKEILHSNGSKKEFFYNKFGQVIKRVVTIDNLVFKHLYDYDKNGNLVGETYPSGFKIRREYVDGILKKVINDANDAVLWKLNTINDLGLFTEVERGNGIVTTYEYTDEGLIESISGGLNMEYEFDFASGNLTKWTDVSNSIFENFGYDNVDRLTSMNLNGLSNQVVTYSTNGNITSKGAISNYEYNPSSMPNAVESVVDNTAIIADVDQDITYNALHQPSLIVEGDFELELSYGSSGQRIYTKLKELGSLKRTRYYVNNYEKQLFTANNKEQEIHYINGGNGLAAIYVIEDGIGTMYYTYSDYLGSILKVTDNLGNVVAEQSFDAWGKKRNVTDWTYSALTSVPDWLYRGYTGHEHYEEFDLINMNGRMYDPILGRMLSVDNYVQNNIDPQNYNRYSYALNNPLKYNDPDGEFFLIKTIKHFVHGFFSSGGSIGSRLKNGAKQVETGFENTFKIVGGLFQGSNQQIWSRFTKELPQTILGFSYANFRNDFILDVTEVDHYGGATAVTSSQKGAVALGSFIVGNEGLRADPNNALFQHEYGHYLQSQEMGWGYLPRVGVPSILDGMNINSYDDHSFHPVEQDANRRAFLYFNENVDGFQNDDSYFDENGWNYFANPFADGVGTVQTATIGGQTYSINYVDYRNTNHINSLDKVRIFTRWYDDASWLIPIYGPIGVGVYNSFKDKP